MPSASHNAPSGLIEDTINLISFEAVSRPGCFISAADASGESGEFSQLQLRCLPPTHNTTPAMRKAASFRRHDPQLAAAHGAFLSYESLSLPGMISEVKMFPLCDYCTVTAYLFTIVHSCRSLHLIIRCTRGTSRRISWLANQSSRRLAQAWSRKEAAARSKTSLGTAVRAYGEDRSRFYPLNSCSECSLL